MRFNLSALHQAGFRLLFMFHSISKRFELQARID